MTGRNACVGIACLVSLVLPPAARAETPSPGAKMRLTLGGGRRMIVRFESIDDGTLTVRPWARLPEPTFKVKPADVTRAELSRGNSRRRNAITGLLAGAAVGALLSVLASTGSGEPPCDGLSHCGPIVMPVTAALGAGIGALSGKERWEPTTLPAGRSPAVSVTLRF